MSMKDTIDPSSWCDDCWNRVADAVGPWEGKVAQAKLTHVTECTCKCHKHEPIS